MAYRTTILKFTCESCCKEFYREKSLTNGCKVRFCSRACHAKIVFATSHVRRGTRGERPPRLDKALDVFMIHYLNQLLDHTFNNVSLAASIAGRNRTHFYKLLARHGISVHKEGRELTNEPGKQAA